MNMKYGKDGDKKGSDNSRHLAGLSQPRYERDSIASLPVCSSQSRVELLKCKKSLKPEPYLVRAYLVAYL